MRSRCDVDGRSCAPTRISASQHALRHRCRRPHQAVVKDAESRGRGRLRQCTKRDVNNWAIALESVSSSNAPLKQANRARHRRGVARSARLPGPCAEDLALAQPVVMPGGLLGADGGGQTVGSLDQSPCRRLPYCCDFCRCRQVDESCGLRQVLIVFIGRAVTPTQRRRPPPAACRSLASARRRHASAGAIRDIAARSSDGDWNSRRRKSCHRMNRPAAVSLRRNSRSPQPESDGRYGAIAARTKSSRRTR